jgi:nucleotide-binding universal stress UspA family protein
MKILVGYDGSDEAGQALDWAASLAKGSEGSSVTVISIAPALEAAPPIADAIDPSSDAPKHRAQLDAAVARLKAAGVQAETVLRAGNPAEEILDMAEEKGFDIIVVGNRGHSSARRFLMGSVSERVMRHAVGPVLVVR